MTKEMKSLILYYDCDDEEIEHDLMNLKNKYEGYYDSNTLSWKYNHSITPDLYEKKKRVEPSELFI